MENMSMAPYVLKQARYGYRMGNAPMVDSMVNDALWDAFGDYHMGITAENVAERWGLTREELDAFAAESQRSRTFSGRDCGSRGKAEKGDRDI